MGKDRRRKQFCNTFDSPGIDDDVEQNPLLELRFHFTAKQSWLDICDTPKNSNRWSKITPAIIFEMWQETSFRCPNSEINSGAVHGRRDYITPRINAEKEDNIWHFKMKLFSTLLAFTSAVYVVGQTATSGGLGALPSGIPACAVRTRFEVWANQ